MQLVSGQRLLIVRRRPAAIRGDTQPEATAAEWKVKFAVSVAFSAAGGGDQGVVRR